MLDDFAVMRSVYKDLVLFLNEDRLMDYGELRKRVRYQLLSVRLFKLLRIFELCVGRMFISSEH